MLSSLQERVSCNNWLQKSNMIVKRKSFKAGKSGFDVVDYIKISNIKLSIKSEVSLCVS